MVTGTSNPLRSNKREFYQLFKRRIHLLKPNLVQEKPVLSPSVFYKMLILNYKKLKHLSYHQQENYPNRLNA